MPQFVDEAGNIWESYGDEPPRYVGKVGGNGGQVVPSDPRQVQQQILDNQFRSADNARGDANLDLSRRDDERAARGEARSTDKQSFDFAKDLRADYDGQKAVQEYRAAIPNFVTGLASAPTPQGDNALIYAYAKVMDPTSVVREGEAAAVSSADTLAGRIVERLKKEIGEGGSFSPTARQGLRDEMQNKLEQLNGAYSLQRQRFRADAENYGIEPDRVIGPHDGQPFKAKIEKLRESRYSQTGRNPLNGDQTGGDNPDFGIGPRQNLPVPEGLQREYEAYVTQNKGNLDPQAYAQFRSETEQKYGLPARSPDLIRQDMEWARDANERARQGQPLNLNLSIDAPATATQRLNSMMLDNPVGAAVLAAPPLAGGLDEVAGRIRALTNGTDPKLEVAMADAMRQNLEDKYKGASIGGSIAGGLVSGYGAGSLFPRAAQALNTLPGMVGAGATLGAANGALENNQDRFVGAGVGAVAGAGGAALGRAIAPVAERASRSAPLQQIGNAIASMRGRQRQQLPVLGPMERAMGPVDARYQQIRQNAADAERLGLPYALADTDPRMRALAGSVSRQSLNARELAEKTFDPRARGQADRAVEAIGNVLSPIADIDDRAKDLRKAGSIAAAPSYNQAYNRAAPVSDGVKAYLETPVGKNALRNAYEIAANEGRDPKSLGFDLNDQGEVLIRELPSFETLDLVKRGVDAILGKERNPVTGRLNTTGRPELQAIEKFRKDFVSELDRINPDYKAARGEYQAYASRAEDLNRGYQANSSRVLPRDLEKITADMKPGNLAEYRTGYATNMADQVERQRLSSDPYNSIYGSPAQQQKIDTLFPEGAPDFRRQYDLEQDMAKTRYETLGGSPTAARMAADRQLSGLGDVAKGVAMDTVAGTGGTATGMGLIRSALRNASDKGKLGFTGAEKKADEISGALFDTNNPRAIIDFLDNYERNARQIAERQSVYARRSGLLGSFAGSGVGGVIGY